MLPWNIAVIQGGTCRVADLDGDGDLDVLNKPYTWNAPRVDIWLNNGAGKLNK